MKRIVVKVGGALLEGSLDSFWDQIETLMQDSEVVLIHGGGPQATRMARNLGHEPQIVEGRRITSEIDLQIVNWVIRGELNLDLVARAGSKGIRAAGLSGADAGTILCTRRTPWQMNGQSVDFGHVGDFVSSDLTAVVALLSAGMLPIVCPPGIDAQGNLLNINADTIALEIACGLAADELILVTESGAVLSADQMAIRRMEREEANEGVETGWIAGGMKVKTDIGFQALDRGVKAVWICGPESISSKSTGTQLVSQSTDQSGSHG